MKFGKNTNLFIFLTVLMLFSANAYSLEKIQSAPVINLEDISPTFEEEKDELEKMNEDTLIINETNTENVNTSKKIKSDKIYVNLKALDKITAKTSLIKILIGEKKYFGELEIRPLKCALSNIQDEDSGTTAYIQVKDLSIKNNDQVFIFNGWTFSSSPNLKPIDHPVYDLWLIGCETV